MPTTTSPTAEHRTDVTLDPTTDSYRWSCSCGEGSRPVLPPHAAQSLADNHAEIANAPQIPDQPDGIEDDSHDLPDPHRAAERIREYISAFGDGLYAVQDGQPLYGRDLEAVCRAVLATPPADTTPTRPHRDEPAFDRPITTVHLTA